MTHLSWRTFSLCLLAWTGTLGAAPIVQYTFPGSGFAPTTTAVGVSANDVNATGSSATLQPGATFPNSAFLQIDSAAATNAAGAVSQNQFFQFTLTPDAGVAIGLTDVTFDAARGGSSSPRGYVLRSSLDGFSTDLGSADITSTQPTLNTYTTVLGPSFSSVLTPVTFRLYGYAPSSGVGLFFDNLTVNGNLTSNFLSRYEFPGSGFSPTTTAANISASDVNATGSAASLQPGATYPNSAFLQVNSALASTAAGAVSEQQYFQFSLGPDSGYSMTPTALLFDAARGGSSTPRGYVVRSSLDGFATDLGSELITTAQPNLLSYGVNLGNEFSGLTSNLTFRIYGFSPSTSTGLFFDNLGVVGTTAEITESEIPEPSSAALLAAGLLACSFARLRRRDRSPGLGR